MNERDFDSVVVVDRLDHARGIARHLFFLYQALEEDRVFGGTDRFLQAPDLARSIADDLARPRDLAKCLRDAGRLDIHLVRAAQLAELVVRAIREGRHDDVVTYTQRLTDILDMVVTSARHGLPLVTTGCPADHRLVQVGRVPRRLSAVAVAVLPAAHRARYRDEYSSELHELAAAGEPPWRQLLHAARLLDRAWVLRAELRAPATRKAQS